MQPGEELAEQLLWAEAVPWIHIRMKPKSNTSKAAKVGSAYAILLHVARMHKRLLLPVPSLDMVNLVV